MCRYRRDDLGTGESSFVKMTMKHTMTQKQKGFVGLGVMVALSAGLILGEEPLYQGVRRLVQGNVSYIDGTYVGTAKGFGGDVIAKVTVTSSGIAAVELTGSGETPDYGGAALKVLPQAFVESGSALVDTVSGATITSQAAMSAVQQALDQASGKIEVIDPDTVLAEKEEEKPQKGRRKAPGDRRLFL